MSNTNHFQNIMRHLLVNDLRNSLYIAKTQTLLLKYAKEIDMKDEHIEELDIMLTEINTMMNDNKRLLEEMYKNDRDKADKDA